MYHITYSDLTIGVADMAAKMRREPFIPDYIVAHADGLVVAALLARKFSYTPTLIELGQITSKLKGSVLNVAAVSTSEQASMYEAIRQVMKDNSDVKIRTAALVECGYQVNYSGYQMPEEPAMPWHSWEKGE